MAAFFKFKGISSQSYGIHILKQPSIPRALERVSRVSVPGRSGSLTYTEGDDVYDDVTLTIECWIEDASRISEISSWLRGQGDLEISTRPGGHYNARVNNQISFEKLLSVQQHRSFSIVFRCGPFWYFDYVSPIHLTTSGSIVNNPGGVHSDPKITVTGTGDIVLTVGGKLIELESITDSIVIDSSAQEAYKGSTLMNGHMVGEFPVLVPGSNAISWTGAVSSIDIEPRWRTL